MFHPLFTKKNLFLLFADGSTTHCLKLLIYNIDFTFLVAFYLDIAPYAIEFTLATCVDLPISRHQPGDRREEPEQRRDLLGIFTRLAK